MGTLANGNLRHKRILAHRALDDLQKSHHMDKWAVYLWLQGKLNLSESQMHIGMFSEDMCDRVIAVCQQNISKHKKAA